MKMLFFAFLFTSNVWSQVLLVPENVKSISSGDVVFFIIEEGGAYFQSSDQVREIFNQVDNSKILYMGSKLGGVTKKLKLVIGPNFNDQDVIVFESNGEKKEIIFRNTYLVKNVTKNKKEFIYQNIELVDLKESRYKKILLICLSLVLAVMLVWIVMVLLEKYKAKKKRKRKIQDWVRRIESSCNMTSCSALWMDRFDMKRDLSYAKPEVDLFLAALSPDQFSPHLSETLSQTIQKSKKDLLQRLKGNDRGV